MFLSVSKFKHKISKITCHLIFFLRGLSQKEIGKIYATFLLERQFLEILFLSRGMRFPKLKHDISIYVYKYLKSVNIVFKYDTKYWQWILLLPLSVILPRFKFVNILEKIMNFRFAFYVLHNSHYKTSCCHGMGFILITNLFSFLCTSATYLFT